MIMNSKDISFNIGTFISSELEVVVLGFGASGILVNMH